MEKLKKITIFTLLVMVCGYVLGSIYQGSFDISTWNREQARDIVHSIVGIIVIGVFFFEVSD